jgi:hypothetical protein
MKMSDAKPPIGPIQRRDDYICQYCGKDGLASLDDWHDSQVDHLVPIIHGGQDTPENKVTSCGYCNAIKGGQPFASLADARCYVLKRRGELESVFQRVRQVVRGVEVEVASPDGSEDAIQS